MRDYARVYHTPVVELSQMRLADFLIEYAEAAEALMEEAKRRQQQAAAQVKRRRSRAKRRR